MWLITTAQLLECGFTTSAIRHRVRIGRLWRVFPGVYAVGNPEMPRLRLARAAVLAGGSDAALSFISAACHLEIWEKLPPGRPQVSIPSRAGRGVRGIEVHRCATLDATDVHPHRGIPTTTVHRTLLDNAAHLDGFEIKAMLRQAQRKHRITLSSVSRHLDPRPARATGAARLRRVLDAYLPKSALTHTEREAMFFELCHTQGLPLPEPQFPIAHVTADFAWPQHMVVAELDDRESHEGAIQHGDDLVRDRIYKAAGWRPERFTVAEAVNQPALVADVLRPLLLAAVAFGSPRRRTETGAIA